MQTLVLQWQDNHQNHNRSITPNTHIRIGRQQDCDIVLPHRIVSRHHVEIWQQGNDWYMRNLSSTNLVHFEQRSLRQGEAVVLQSGLQFRIGPVWFQATVAAPVGQGLVEPQAATVLASSAPPVSPPVPPASPVWQQAGPSVPPAPPAWQQASPPAPPASPAWQQASPPAPPAPPAWQQASPPAPPAPPAWQRQGNPVPPAPPAWQRQASPPAQQPPASPPVSPRAPGPLVPKLKCVRCDTVQDYKPEGFCYSCGLALQAAGTVMIAS